MKKSCIKMMPNSRERFGLIMVLLGALSLPSGAQDLSNVPLEPDPAVPRVSSTLQKMTATLSSKSLNAPTSLDVQAFASKGMRVQKSGKILVEIIGPESGVLEQDLDLAALKKLGVEVGTIEPPVQGTNDVVKILSATTNRAEALLPLGSVEAVGRLMPEGYFIKEVLPPCEDAVNGQGPDVTNSDTYRDAGRNGTGLTIAVIDSGYEGLGAAQTNGDAPAAYTAINYTPEAFETWGFHGTGCVEASFDHCPGATWRIYKIDSVADLTTVVNNCIANGVDVITHSQSRYNEGWADNSGTACAAANHASNNGILFFTSAGNRAESHYEGTFTDSDGDDWHEFAPGDESIDLTISPAADGNYYLCWSNSGSDFDYYLYNSDRSVVVASSVNTGNGVFESFYYDNPGATATFHLSVRRKGGSTSSTLEIFTHNAGTWNEHAVAESSTTSPSNATGLRVLSIGAVTQSLYGSANGSSVISSYSSQGPSNSGMTLPDLCGPTDTSEFTYATFGGTSCATPNAAGAACAFWSDDTGMDGAGIAWLLLEKADLWRDWGTSGNDNIYGRGGVRIADYDYGTRWLARNYPGTVDDGSVPFETLAAAHSDVPDNGRLFIFGQNFGTFPEAATLGDTGKSMDVVVVPDSSSALMGQ